MRDLLRSEGFAWAFMGERLEKGLHALNDLADRDVIPGASIEVLTDRLHLNLCICGEPLPEGSERRTAVERLRTEQQQVSQNRQRLTALFHTARQTKAGHDATSPRAEISKDRGHALLEEFTDGTDSRETKAIELDSLMERRAAHRRGARARA